jgi:hypothetical protein
MTSQVGRPVASFVLLASTALALAGCGTAPDAAVVRGRIDAAPVTTRAALVWSLPFYGSPREDDCGSCALATVLARAGHPRRLDDVRAAIYDPERGGAPTSALVRYARDQGLFALVREHWYLDDLKAWIRAGVPPIVLLSASPLGAGKFHYVLLTGYDDDGRVVLARDQIEREFAIPYDAFFPRWCEADGWALVVTSPSIELPPDHCRLTALELGALGWLAEQAQDLASAERHYRSALEVDPKFAPARRNLAHVEQLRAP